MKHMEIKDLHIAIVFSPICGPMTLILQGSVQLTDEILEGGETTVPFQVGGGWWWRMVVDSE